MRVPRLRASPRYGGAERFPGFFQSMILLLIRRGGVPSGAAQVIAGAGLALPDSTGIVQLSWETLRFQQLANHLVSEGTVPVPRTLPALCDGVVLPSLELSLLRRCHSSGDGG